MTHAMLKGSNVQLETASLRAELCWSPGSRAPDIDASALLLGEDDRVRTDEDFVFYNQPQHPSEPVRHVAKKQEADGVRDSVEVSLDSLAPGVARVMLSASSDGGTFADVADLQLKIYGAGAEAGGEPLVLFDIEPETGSETAIICGELYRRGDGWKFRALGQGYETGLLGLATEFGVSVSAEDAPETAHREDSAEPAPAPAPDEDLDATVAVAAPHARDAEDFPLPAPRPQAIPDLPPGPPSVPPPVPPPSVPPGAYRPDTQAGAAAFMAPGSDVDGGMAASPGQAGEAGWTGRSGYDSQGATQALQHGSAYPQQPQHPPSTQPAYGYPQPAYGYPQPDPNFTLPPQGPQFLNR